MSVNEVVPRVRKFMNGSLVSSVIQIVEFILLKTECDDADTMQSLMYDNTP